MSSVSLINGHIDDDNYIGDITHNVYVKVVEEADQMLFKTIKRIGNEYKLNFLVDKSKVIEALTDYQRKINGTADLVEVIRCKDCVSFVKRDGFCWCEEHSDGFGSHIVYVDEDDYCSYGERRDDK